MTEEVIQSNRWGKRQPSICYTKQIEIANISGCHSGTHQVVVVGCPVERGAVTSEVSGVKFGVGGGSVQRGLIHWGHPEEVVAEQEKGLE